MKPFLNHIRYTYDNRRIDNSYIRYNGKKIIAINTASQCGFTEQVIRESIQLITEFSDKIDIVLYPSNDFDQNNIDFMDVYKDYRLYQYYPNIKIMKPESLSDELFTSLRYDTNFFGDNPVQINWNNHKFFVGNNGTVEGYLTHEDSLLTNDVLNWIKS